MDEIRERILEAAYDEFASRGLSQTTLAEVAKHAHTEVGAIRALFVDRKGLLTAVLDEKTAPLVSAVSLLLSEKQDLRQLLPNALRIVHQFISDEPRYTRIIASAALDGAELLGAVFARSFFPSEFHDRLEEAVQQGELRARSAMTALTMLDSLLLFPHLMRPAMTSGLPPDADLDAFYDEYFANVLALLERGLFADRTEPK